MPLSQFAHGAAKTVMALSPAGRRFLDHHEKLKDERTGVIQQSVPTHHRLLTGDLEITKDKIETRGMAIAPEGLTGGMRFFINGRPFDEVHYPVPDDYTNNLFSHIEGGAGFMARATQNLAPLKAARFFRIDASPTGAYVEHDWRHAMWFMNPVHERFDFPPADNIRRVIGDAHIARFGMGGATIYHNVGAMLREMGTDWSAFPTILDWGCGAGRITRYLISETNAEVHGADIDVANVAWCAANLHPGKFRAVPLAPPTSFADKMFNLVIGASVVTHLTEEMQFAWLAELNRITAPGALVFLSVSGPVQFAYMGIPTDLFYAKEAAGFLDARRDPALDGHIANAEYYRTVWHSRRYIASTWSRYFDVVAIVDGIAALQDFVILRRRHEDEF